MRRIAESAPFRAWFGAVGLCLMQVMPSSGTLESRNRSKHPLLFCLALSARSDWNNSSPQASVGASWSGYGLQRSRANDTSNTNCSSEATSMFICCKLQQHPSLLGFLVPESLTSSSQKYLALATLIPFQQGRCSSSAPVHVSWH